MHTLRDHLLLFSYVVASLTLRSNMAHVLYPVLVLLVTLLSQHGKCDHAVGNCLLSIQESHRFNSEVESILRRAISLDKMHWHLRRNSEETSGNVVLLLRSMGASISGK